MRPTNTGVVVVVVFSSIASLAQAQSPASVPPGPNAAVAAPKSPQAQQAESQLAALKAKLNEAAGNRVQIKTAEGGTLGLPRQSLSSGVQANVDLHAGGNSSSPDVLASYGGLDLSDNFAADAFAEIVDQDVPKLALDGTTVDHKTSIQKLTSGGIRIQARFSHSLYCRSRAEEWSSKDEDEKKFKRRDAIRLLLGRDGSGTCRSGFQAWGLSYWTISLA